MNNSGDKIIKQQVDNMQVSFDKEAAWMRLQDRLESKDEKKGYFRMGWVAAAVLMVATVLWYSLSNDTKQPVVQTTPKITQPISVEEPKKYVTEPIAEKKNSTIAPQRKNVSVAVQPKEIKEVVKEIVSEPIIVKEETVPIQETPKILSAAKGKMKTVHINEVIQDQRIEERMNQSKYAGENNSIFQMRHSGKQESNSTYENYKKSLFTEYNDDYRIIQN
jgi:hypothetical protein